MYDAIFIKEMLTEISNEVYQLLYVDGSEIEDAIIEISTNIISRANGIIEEE